MDLGLTLYSFLFLSSIFSFLWYPFLPSFVWFEILVFHFINHLFGFISLYYFISSFFACVEGLMVFKGDFLSPPCRLYPPYPHCARVVAFRCHTDFWKLWGSYLIYLPCYLLFLLLLLYSWCFPSMWRTAWSISYIAILLVKILFVLLFQTMSLFYS